MGDWWSALAPRWESAVRLTLLTEDRGEWVLSGLGWRGDQDLDVHHVSPGSVGLHAEHVDGVDDLIVDVVDLLVDRWDDDQAGDHGDQRAGGGDPHEELLFEHPVKKTNKQDEVN